MSLNNFSFPYLTLNRGLGTNLRSDLGYIALQGETMIEVTALCDEAHPVGLTHQNR